MILLSSAQARGVSGGSWDALLRFALSNDFSFSSLPHRHPDLGLRLARRVA